MNAMFTSKADEWKHHTFHPARDISAAWAVEHLEELANLKFEALAHPFDIFQLGPTIHLCLSFSTPSFCAWEDVENALLSGSGTHLQRLMAEVDLFSKELRTVYDRDARHKRRQTLCNLQFWALVIFSILFLIWTMWTSGHIPRGWTAAILFPSLLLFFFELFLLTCTPSRTVVGDVDTKVSRLLGQLGGLNERYTLLKELVDAGDTKAIAVLLEHEGHRKLSQLSIKHRPDANGA